MRRSRATRIALWAYAAALVVLLAGPWGNLLHRLTVRLYVQFLYTWPIAPDWVVPEHYGYALNVLLFVPVGAGLVLLTRWHWWQATLAAALASTAFELLQLVLPRVAQPVDVLTNTMGAALGALAVSACVRLRHRRGR